MRLGVLSDTHNHVLAALDAVEALWADGARRFVHCGDIGPDVLDDLSAWAQARRTTLWWAYGNCDFGYPDASAYAVPPPSVIGGWHVEPDARLAAIHGHDSRLRERLLASGRYDVILCGHTHCPSAIQAGHTWLLNPGSAARPRSDNGPTALLLDWPESKWQWLKLRSRTPSL